MKYCCLTKATDWALLMHCWTYSLCKSKRHRHDFTIVSCTLTSGSSMLPSTPLA